MKNNYLILGIGMIIIGIFLIYGATDDTIIMPKVDTLENEISFISEPSNWYNVIGIGDVSDSVKITKVNLFELDCKEGSLELKADFDTSRYYPFNTSIDFSKVVYKKSNLIITGDTTMIILHIIKALGEQMDECNLLKLHIRNYEHNNINH